MRKLLASKGSPAVRHFFAAGEFPHGFVTGDKVEHIGGTSHVVWLLDYYDIQGDDDEDVEEAWGLYNAFTYVIQKSPAHEQINGMNRFRELMFAA